MPIFSQFRRNPLGVHVPVPPPPALTDRQKQQEAAAERRALKNVLRNDGTPPTPVLAELSRSMLGGLARLPHVYQGTVPGAVVAGRRTKNRAARRARRNNR